MADSSLPDAARATRAAAEVARMNAFFPIMPLLGNRLAATRPFEGMTVGVSAHLTTVTAALIQELTLGGGDWFVAGASAATTDQGVVALLRAAGVRVHTPGAREDHHRLVLDQEPDLLADAGGDLIGTHLRESPDRVLRGAVEVTKSGADRLRDLPLIFPCIDLNAGRLKPAIENRHGVGEGLWQAVQRLTGMHLSGRRVGVIGYGPVGRGLAAYARAAGACVEVVEMDPIRSLVAHYDGYPTPTLEDCVRRVDVVATATGRAEAVPLSVIRQGRSGLVLVNAGHGDREIDVRGVRGASASFDQITDLVVRHQIEGGPEVVILGDGHPLNIVTNAGSPEPVLLHFAALGLALAWLATAELPAGRMVVPEALEQDAARLALRALSPGGAGRAG